MKTLLKLAAAIALVLVALSASAQDKVVYHFDAGLSQATKGLRNMRNRDSAGTRAIAWLATSSRRIGTPRWE